MKRAPELGPATLGSGKLNVFALFHLNLAFSSIEEEQRPEVVERCYWPLLRLPDAIDAPLAIEATGYTLETIAAIDASWIAELRRLVSTGRVEFIGSGYAQLIGPLVPANVNDANLTLGNVVYERLLGIRPSIALVNEQAYAAGLVPLYLDAGYRALLMDWDNVAAHHPEWNPKLRFYPQRARGVDGSEIALLWTHTMAFQKLQRLAHGDIEHVDYAAYIENQRGHDPRLLPLYSNDAEIFDFRPKRFHTEEALQTGEWQIIAQAWGRLARSARTRFVKPSEALAFTDNEAANQLLDLQTADYPIPVKKHKKYNITRWAVSGRDDLAINAACHRLHRGLTQRNVNDPKAWRELCYLWSSDFRTHITPARWNRYRERLAAAENAYAAPPTALPEPLAKPALRTEQKWLEIETPSLCAVLNRRRGLAIHEIRARDDRRPAMLGSLLHGHYDTIDLQADWYTGNCVFEAPGTPKITDLEWAEPHIYGDAETADAIVETEIATPLGPIFKRLRFAAHEPRVDFDLVLSWKEMGRGSLRLGHFLLNPAAFDLERLSFSTHNGGRRAETFPLAHETVDHGKPVSFLVSASSGLGLTEGSIEVGDDSRSFRILVDQTVAPLIGLVHHERIGDSIFSRLLLSALELDDTRKPEPSATPRHYRFSLLLQT
ncbi:MAG: glycoside hydrolase family 57 [Alphaproteobacteria bacterium]|nr:glycoside hydrolase family 57 [Alphaproteobacteria bacterium]